MRKSNHHQTPLFTQLLSYSQQNPFPFHIPGHKKGQGMDEEFRRFLGEQVLSTDLINIPPLDNLHQPQGVLQEAQELFADAFGAEHAFFSVQGTTHSILTMLLASCRPGDQLILPRNIHQSVVSALILAGIHPCFIPPASTSYLDITNVPSLENIDEMLIQHPQARALFLIHPTYFGNTSSLSHIVQRAHASEIPVLVDEAHGVLNYFHPAFPISAMEAGADLAAISIHKGGGSLTQTSILLAQGDYIQPRDIQTVSSMLTTTSTSYLLLASLDTARRQLALHGFELAEQVLQLTQQAREEIQQIPGLRCEEPMSTTVNDISKLVIRLQQLQISGHEAAHWLREKHQIEVELSGYDHLLCLITIGDSEESIHRLLEGLRDLAQTYYCPSATHDTQMEPLLPMPELVVQPRDAFYHPKKWIPFEQSIGQICAQTIMTYPPGVPIFLPGEKITSSHMEYIHQLIQQGSIIQGLDLQEKKIYVIA